MPRPREIDYLQPDEVITTQTRRHALSAVDGFIAMTLAWGALTGAITWAAVAILPPVADTYAWTAATIVALAWIAGMTALHWRRATSLFVVTPERVYGSHGRIRFNLTQTTYDKVTDMHVHQTVFGRLWGYGTVKVQTAGTGISLPGVNDPMRFKQVIEEQRSEFLERLVGQHKSATTGKRTEPRRRYRDAEVLWTGSPAPATLIGAGIISGIMGLIGLGALAVGLFVSLPALGFGALFLLVAGAIFAGAYIQFRFTAFDVTDRGVVLRKGWLSRRRVEATYAKVTDVSVNQDILARLLKYGTITVNTAGSNEAPVVFAGVADPYAVKAVIDDARDD